jgi:hypothetical protein
VRLEAESYGDHETAEFIDEHFVPFTVNIHDKAGLFGRFQAAWTPTVLIMSHKGVERYRIEGYLPRSEFRPQLELGLARVAFMAKDFNEAERWYDHIANNHISVQPEALYWRAVCRYNQTHDPSPLGEVAQELSRNHSDSIWATKASVWMPAEVASTGASVR